MQPCTQLLIQYGSTERKEVFVEHGGIPVKQYLAAFPMART
jgi:hypothetical protein